MLQLHCFSQSGNCFKVAFFLRHLGVPFEPVFVDFFAGTTRGAGWRASTNAMGEAPVLVRDDGRALTQSGAILTWLAEQHGRGGGRDADERLEVLRWLLWDNHKFTSHFATMRFMRSFMPTAPDPVVMGFLRGRSDAAWRVLDQHLAGRQWVVGDAPTIADFSLCGYVFYPADESGIDITTQYPQIDAWRQRLAALPGWAGPYDAMPGARIAPRWTSA
jgi:glutathione S-transferase